MKKGKGKQIIAMTAIVLLVALYVVTLITAFLDSSASGQLFKFCLICTIVVPVLAWIFIWIYGQTTGKKTIADLNLMQDPEEISREEEGQKEESSTADQNSTDADM